MSGLHSPSQTPVSLALSSAPPRALRTDPPHPAHEAPAPPARPPLCPHGLLLSPAQSPAAPVDPLQQAYAGMQHYTGEEPPARPRREGGQEGKWSEGWVPGSQGAAGQRGVGGQGWGAGPAGASLAA